VGAISFKGRLGEVVPPHLVLQLTVEPTKPRLCHDARFLNLWMRDMPYKLDTLLNIPRYAGHDTYHTILDDKSRYDYLLLTEESRTFFGIQWGGWYFVYNTLPFCWKISSFDLPLNWSYASVFSVLWGSLAHCTLMIVIKASSRYHPDKVPMQIL